VRALKFLLIALLAACAGGDPRPLPTAPPAWAEAVVLMITPKGRCSAVMITPHAALTARHCTETVNAAVLKRGGRVVIVDSVIQHPDRDVSILSLASDMPGPYAFESSRLPRAGEAAFVVGFGCDYPARGVRRLVALGRSVEGLAFAGRVCGGDSGGGVFNSRGELVAITSARNADSTLAFAAVLR
jgi:S1-C subfamily serine protease